jgi:hypothetical protein
MTTAESSSSPPVRAAEAPPPKPVEQQPDLRPYLQALLQKQQQGPPAKRCGSCPFADEQEIPCKLAVAILGFASTFIISVLLFLLLRSYQRQY